jgi:hypothetical protein
MRNHENAREEKKLDLQSWDLSDTAAEESSSAFGTNKRKVRYSFERTPLCVIRVFEPSSHVDKVPLYQRAREHLIEAQRGYELAADWMGCRPCAHLGLSNMKASQVFRDREQATKVKF